MTMISNKVTSWITKTIGDCCIVGDGIHASIKRQPTGIMYLTSKNFKNGGLDLSKVDYIFEEDYQKHFRENSKALTKPQTDDVLFSIIGTLGEPYLFKSQDRFGLSSSVSILRPNKSVIFPQYLYYWIKGYIFQHALYSIKGGVAQSYVSLEMIRSLPLYYPPLSTQNKIASILSTYDDLIENNTRRIKILEEMAQTLYNEWFVKFRFPGHEQVNKIESQLGLIPEGWIGKLEDALILQRGFDLPIKKRQPGNFPVYAATGIIGTHKEAKIKAPGIVTGRSGSLGTVMYVDEDFWALNTTLWVKEFRKVTPIYALFLLKSLGLEQYNSGAAVPTLNRNDIHGLPVVIPSAKILEKFNSNVEPLFILKKNLIKINENLRQTRDLLLPKLISGEIDVENLDIDNLDIAA
ncbi:MAG: restriction endonuclease subunit S [Nostoc sp.]